jgi:hypothetical protein
MAGQIDHCHHSVTTFGAEFHSLLLAPDPAGNRFETPKVLENQGIATIFQPPNPGTGEKPTKSVGFNKPEWFGQVSRAHEKGPKMTNNRSLHA